MSLKEWLICAVIVVPLAFLILKFGHNSVSEKNKLLAGRYCEKTIQQVLSLEVEWKEAGFLQLGTTSKYTNNDGLLFIWKETAGKKEIKCTTSLNAKKIRYLGVDGHNLTKLVKLEERE